MFATASPSMLDTYDYVISAVYGNPNLLRDPSRQQDHYFSLCEMMMVELPADYAGLSAMIVYGPFMTIDVLGATGNHVLYHGDHGVHHVNVGRFADVPAVYQPFLYRFTPARRPRRPHPRTSRAAEARRYFEGLDEAHHIASNFVVRVQAPHDVRNAVRRTTIQEFRPGWFSISASKLSACVSIADTMIRLLQRQGSGRWIASRPRHRSPVEQEPVPRIGWVGADPAQLFRAADGLAYLDSATYGLAPLPTTAAMRQALAAWERTRRPDNVASRRLPCRGHPAEATPNWPVGSVPEDAAHGHRISGHRRPASAGLRSPRRSGSPRGVASA